ncbi:uncharacterized protein LOC100822702 [Brachypodium distachyon]|uniref:Senescence regulator n=1 Tax=Brachypodium distachyon TaxID=15368 RepID=I1IZR5_BRADI|nr:uncharacterized protein LOC100822702 [Brachypodium distachyon]KQJ83641.1 hypothetical protein BRADI_5g15950v3 [Brachypodium distachyon]|eukprot:XP_003580155.1 uncharacterized protein LOC100822702 [Brachypodium distachyon]
MAGSARSAAAKHGYGRMFAPTWGSAAARGGAAEEFDESDVWGSFGSAADYSPADLARAAAARPIPQPVLVRAGAGSGRKNPQLDRPAVRGSLPMSIPDWQKILGVEYRDHYRAGEWEVNGGDDDDYGKVMIPPHELAWRSRAASMSVHEGIGRTLKGRDLSRVRDAVWKKTGFED